MTVLRNLVLTLGLIVTSCAPVTAEPEDIKPSLDFLADRVSNCDTYPDRWGIREPTDNEVLEYGRGVLVFEYFNSPYGCSYSIAQQGVWYQGERFGMLSVEILGKEFDRQERVQFDPFLESGYTHWDAEPLMIHDSEDPATIILYPNLY